MDFDKRLTTGDVAGIMRCSQQVVIDLCNREELRCYRLMGNHRRIALGDVIEYCKENKVPAVIDGKVYQPENLPDTTLRGRDFCSAVGDAVACIISEGYLPTITKSGQSVVLKYQHHEGEYQYQLNPDQTTIITVDGKTGDYVGWWPRCAGL